MWIRHLLNWTGSGLFLLSGRGFLTHHLAVPVLPSRIIGNVRETQRTALFSLASLDSRGNTSLVPGPLLACRPPPCIDLWQLLPTVENNGEKSFPCACQGRGMNCTHNEMMFYQEVITMQLSQWWQADITLEWPEQQSTEITLLVPKIKWKYLSYHRNVTLNKRFVDNARHILSVRLLLKTLKKIHTNTCMHICVHTCLIY